MVAVLAAEVIAIAVVAVACVAALTFADVSFVQSENWTWFDPLAACLTVTSGYITLV